MTSGDFVPSEPTVTDGVDERLQRLRAQRREGEEGYFPTLPPSIREIVASEVRYVLNPRALPLRAISRDARSLRRFHNLLQQEYRLSLKSSLRLRPGDDELIALEQEFGSDDPEVVYVEGVWLVGGRAIPIRSVGVGFESVDVRVVGPTEVGERLIQELVELMWYALDAPDRTWDELKRDVQVIYFGSGTRVTFPHQGLGLLSEGFVRALEEWTEPGGIARDMASRTVLDEFRPPANASATFTVDEVGVLFHTARSGRAETAGLRIGVDARFEQGSGVMTVSSQLPFPDHLRLVESLLAAVSEEAAPRGA
jgi:hypothetical protein